MTQATPNNYWISSTALHIEPNALGNPDYIQASCVSGAQILVYVKDIIGYDAGHNYRRWSLQASPTVFNTHTVKYVYAAIPRNDDTKPAIVVFPSEVIDIYGKNASEEQIGTTDYYYINLGGIITSSGDNGTTNREWLRDEDGLHTVVTGLLSSDEAIAAGPTDSEWYQYSTVDQITTFLKDLTMKAGTKFLQLYAKALTIVTGGSITFGEGEDAPTITGVAELGDTPANDTPLTSNEHIVTPAYGEGQWLSKKHDDTAEGNLTFHGTLDVFGNLVANADTTIKGKLVAESTSHLKGNVTIGTPLPSTGGAGGGSMQHWGKSEWGTFIKGIITGSGAQIDINGNAELESLVIRRFLEVPELRYNRVSVHSGTEWFTKGIGLIESVEPIDDTHGKVKLHLEDGEISTIAEDDYCMGIFHNLNGNAEQTTDDKQGTMQYSGFCTVYFRIQEITETAHNSEFIYELRPCSDSWSHSYHPQPQMTFACYANPNRKDRQSAVLKTTDYTVYIENSTQWTFGADNYYLIMGQLEGFSVWATNKKGERYLKHLHGNGTMLGNVYMFGVIDQFDRLADTIDITASPRINADFTVADGETLTLTAQMLSYDGIKRTGVVYSIKRYSDNPDSDAEWNERRGNDIAGGTIELTTDDTLIGDGVYDPAVQFTILATRILPAEEGGDPYTIERDIVVRNVGGYKLTDDNADPMIALGEAKQYNFQVNAPRGGDITSKVERWTIERHSSDPTADTLWAMRDKVKAFAGSISLIWSSDPTENDMDPNETISGTSFLIAAYIGTTPVAQEEITL